MQSLTENRGTTKPLGEQGKCTLFLYQGKVYALGHLCPHQNAPLDGAPVENGQVVCNRHGYCYKLGTGSCSTLGGYALPRYPVEIENGMVIVTVREF